MPPGTEETMVRAAAIAWLQERTLGGTLELSREQLANDFYVAGARFPLVDRGRGIRKPAGWQAALSIMTAAPKSGRARPYEDVEGMDGLHRYKLRRDQGGSAENESLRVALREQTPLIWFYGIEPGVFNVICPVWLVAEEPDKDQPDYVVEIHEKLLYEQDGPMLTHGLQEHHGKDLMRVPVRISDQPDPTRIEERYEEFRAA